MNGIGNNNGLSGKGFGKGSQIFTGSKNDVGGKPLGGPGGVPNVGTSEDIGAVIDKAAEDRKVTGGEATKIIKAADTPAAREQVVELFDRTPREILPGQMVTMAMPENPNDVVFAGAAVNRLNVFFTQFDLPAGQNLVNKIESRLNGLDVGTPITPPYLSGMRAVSLPYPEGAADVPNRRAYFNKDTNEFYLEVSGGFMAPNRANTFYYGPFSLTEAVAPPITEPSADRKAQLVEAFQKLQTAGLIQFTGGAVAQPPGAAFGELVLDDNQSPDGFKYSLVIPLGALTATGPAKDINTVPEFYIQREGGVAGMTMSAGPFTAPL